MYNCSFSNKQALSLTDKPKRTSVDLTSNPAYLNSSVTITCTSVGFPEPTFRMTHNNTIFLTTNKSYTIEVVNYTHAGWYKCVATNDRGNDSDSEFLNVTGNIEVL